jgi:hypothetical protein
MTRTSSHTRIRFGVNAQQLDFIERVRSEHYPHLSIADMVRHAVAETEVTETGLLRDKVKPDA